MCANIPERFRSRDTIICGEFALFRFKSSQRKFSWAPAFYGDDRGSCLMATENHLGSTQTRESSVGTNLLKAVCDDDDDAMAWHLIGHAVHVLWRANFLLFHFFFFCFRRVFFHFYSFIICSSSMFGFFFFHVFAFCLMSNWIYARIRACETVFTILLPSFVIYSISNGIDGAFVTYG